VQGIYDGSKRELSVRPPRVDTAILVDGRLDEPVWQSAALLTGFSQFAPRDGIPAEDSTQVLAWYSPKALYFGIRAFEHHGAPHATLAQRDHVLDVDDNVQILLGTFNDSRQANLIAVNPLGVQADGTLRETYQAIAGSWWERPTARQVADLSPDFVFESKGRVTDWGYEVEIRLPFKSLTFQSGSPQSWSINVVRRVQHSGYEDSWAPARLANVSFLAQSGTLVGLTDLHRGLVLDVNPVITQRTVGSPKLVGAVRGGWNSEPDRPQLGTNLRWRVTNNATVNATVMPDFSQVESDAGQLITDPRAALYFPEKRPFFLDSQDAFATPNNLVYTRTIQQPTAALKLATILPRTSIAVLSAVEDASVSLDPASGRAPVSNIVRLQRDLGTLSRVGVTYTDRLDGPSTNHVGDLDAAVAFSRNYALSLQLAASRTTTGSSVVSGPLWAAGFDRNGERFGLHYAMTGMDSNFQTQTGFIPRPGFVTGQFAHRFTHFGARGNWLEAASFDPTYLTNWKYRNFVEGRDAIEKKLQLITRYQLRGGWTGALSLLVETFGFDPDLYRNTYVARNTGARIDTVLLSGPGRIPNRDFVVALNTPQWSWFSLNLLYLWGHDEDFDEWASADVKYSTIDALLRPTERIRITPSIGYVAVARRTSGETQRTQRVARLTTEYQLARPLFVRMIGEFDELDLLSLRDEGRSNDPLLMRNPDGTFTPLDRSLSRAFHGQWLLAWQPNPGTVFFAGYGNNAEPKANSLAGFLGRRYRQSDVLFFKASYLWRL
jgi:hypothetical protein